MTPANIQLLHGWGYDASVMQPLARALEKDFAVQQTDVPGYTTTSDRCRTMADIVDCLADTAADDGVLVGWSLGGNVALQLAGQGPVERPLVLICCNPSFVLRPDWPCALNPVSITGLRDSLLQDPVNAMKTFAGWCAMGERSIKRSRRALFEYAAAAHIDPDCLAVGLDVLQDLDQRALLATLECRVLMLFAGADRLVPVGAADFCRGLSERITVHVIEDCGHGLPVSMPGRTAAVIKEFLG